LEHGRTGNFRRMRVVVFGASGNVGTVLMRALADEPAVSSVVGVARRLPRADVREGAEWASADVARDDLEPLVHGADAVVHLAWRIQPARRLEDLFRTNVIGSSRVFDAVARSGVKTLVYASSVGAYARAPQDRLVDESWPVEGISSAFYARHKAEVERRLDRFESEHPDVGVARMRTALIFHRASASQQRRLFLGPLVPTGLLRPGLLPLVPAIRRLRFQALHAEDAAAAYRLALLSGAQGAFNVAGEPVLAGDAIARVLEAKPLWLPPGLVRGAMSLTWRLRLQPSEPGWLDMGLQTPLLDTSRARSALGWRPRIDALETLREFVAGVRAGAGMPTPALDPEAGGTLRWRELATMAASRETV
jgi:UDP-glucose 4-epimerase